MESHGSTGIFVWVLWFPPSVNQCKNMCTVNFRRNLKENGQGGSEEEPEVKSILLMRSLFS